MTEYQSKGGEPIAGHADASPELSNDALMKPALENYLAAHHMTSARILELLDGNPEHQRRFVTNMNLWLDKNGAKAEINREQLLRLLKTK